MHDSDSQSRNNIILASYHTQACGLRKGEGVTVRSHTLLYTWHIIFKFKIITSSQNFSLKTKI